jgi:hypothetical protein
MMLNVGVSFLRSALIGGILASAWLSGARAEGGPPISGGVRYAIGVVEVVESTESLDFFSRSNRLGAVRIRPGGAMMPEVDVSDSGVLSIGRKRIDVRNGALLHSPKPSACEARLSKARDNWLRVNQDIAMLLVPRTDRDGRVLSMSSQIYALQTCKELSRERIFGDWLDHYAEFGASKHGWWLVGSDEGFVLVHPMKQGWVKLPMPQSVGNVLSAKWASDGYFWILANRLDGQVLTPTLYRTIDLGLNWAVMGVDVQQAPAYWFEGIREFAKLSTFSATR